MSFQIYQTGSLVINSGSFAMDPGGFLVASNWSGSTNIHPLSSSDDIYRNNGPIGENYYVVLDGVNDGLMLDESGTGLPADNERFGFEVDNTGSNAGVTYSWWWKTFDTSDHWDGAHFTCFNGTTTYYALIDSFYGSGGPLANVNGLQLPSDNDWHHMVFTYDSGSEKTYVYIDGIVKEEYDSTNSDIPLRGGLLETNDAIGLISNFSGAIDEFAFCQRFLSPSDLAPFGKAINLMKKKDELKLKVYLKCGDGSEQASGSNIHSLVNGAGEYSTGSYFGQLSNGAHIGSASAHLLRNSGKVVNFNV